MGSPFDLTDIASYQLWRDLKIQGYPKCAEDLVIGLENTSLSTDQLSQIEERLYRANLVIYRFDNACEDERKSLLQIAKQLGLRSIDGNLCSDKDAISSISVSSLRKKGEYIPYTNRKLNWHTDGYYNPSGNQIRTIIMHCLQPALQGGDNAYLDHEIAYILLRNQDPAYIKALTAPDVFRIPANIQDGIVIRPEYAGPVFSVDENGFLHMRFSARSKNIVWKNDITTQKAVDFLLNLLESESPYILRYRLQPNEGIISNNVLHMRSLFTDSENFAQKRLLLRARFYDRATIQ